MITDDEFGLLLQVFLSAAPSCGKSAVMTIDGPSGSGKTTLANRLQASVQFEGKTCTVIHLDDHYNGWTDALGPSLTTMLSDQLFPSIEKGMDFSLPRFDWGISAFQGAIHYSCDPIIIIEGVGSGQKISRTHIALSVWIEVSDALGLSRVLDRDGATIREQMRQFQSDQREHFIAESTKEHANYRLEGS